MKRTSLTVIAVCATLLWVGAVHAGKVVVPATGGLSACQKQLNLSTANLLTCTNNLSTCETDLSAAQAFPATGQTTSYAAGDDGAIKAGAALSYTDNGDGTITDNNTKLMWEKKDEASGGLHNVNNTYPWSGLCQDGTTPCGTSADCSGVPGTALCTAIDGQGTGWTIFQWVTQLNAAGFAGHTDWRVPNVKELQSIADYENFNPAVDTAFNTSCSADCTVTTCSCTRSIGYWSATTIAGFGTGAAWFVNFGAGQQPTRGKINSLGVRAVRSGL